MKFGWKDISRETFGKYQNCTQYDGKWYADEDFDRGPGIGKPKRGAIPAPDRKSEPADDHKYPLVQIQPPRPLIHKRAK